MDHHQNQNTYIEILEAVITDVNGIIPRSLQNYKADSSIYIRILEDNILEYNVSVIHLQKDTKLSLERSLEITNVIQVINEHRKTL